MVSAKRPEVVFHLAGQAEGDFEDALAAEVAAAIEGRGGSALACTADVTTAEGVERLTSEALSRFERVDILGNNVGHFTEQHETQCHSWQEIAKIFATFGTNHQRSLQQI